jgi:hypothetical protein
LLFILVEVVIGFIFVFACCARASRRYEQMVGLAAPPTIKISGPSPHNRAKFHFSLRQPDGQQRRNSFDGKWPAHDPCNYRHPPLFSLHPVALHTSEGLANMSKRQRKKIQKQIRKVTSALNLHEISHENERSYHTYHSGQFGSNPKLFLAEQGKFVTSTTKESSRSSSSSKRRVLDKWRVQHHRVENGVDSDDSLSEADIPSRFRVISSSQTSAIAELPVHGQPRVPVNNRFRYYVHVPFD